jgi:O-antigen ligase
MREGFAAFLAHPLTGIGFGQFPNYNPGGRVEAWRQTHNAVLQVAAELGIIGLAAFGYMLGTGFSSGFGALRAGRQKRKRRLDPAETTAWLHVYGGVLIAALTGWFVAAQFASVAYYWTLYLLLGAATALRLAKTHAGSVSRTEVPGIAATRVA